jgi:hypothetical protein
MKRISITIQRDGKAEGLTMLAGPVNSFTTFNPFNTFIEVKESDVDSFNNTLSWVKSVSDRYFHWPQHAILLMIQHSKLDDTTLSFPECGLLPGVQAMMMYYIIKLLLDTPDRKVKIRTVSEYMVRALQLIVASGIFPAEDIEILDQENKDSVEVNLIDVSLKE